MDRAGDGTILTAGPRLGFSEVAIKKGRFANRPYDFFGFRGPFYGKNLGKKSGFHGFLLRLRDDDVYVYEPSLAPLVLKLHYAGFHGK